MLFLANKLSKMRRQTRQRFLRRACATEPLAGVHCPSLGRMAVPWPEDLVNTRHPANPRRALRAVFCAAGLALAGTFAYADEHESDAPGFRAPPTNAFGQSSTELHIATTGVRLLVDRLWESMTPEQRDTFMRELERELEQVLPETTQLSVSVKDNDASCFLKGVQWASCLNNLPPEPRWEPNNVPKLPPPSVLQLRSLWTKTPVERLE